MSKCCFIIHIMASLGASNHVPQKLQQKFIRSSRARGSKNSQCIEKNIIRFNHLQRPIDRPTDRPTDPPMTDTVISDTEIRTNPIPVLQTAKSLIQGQGSQEGEWYQNSCPCIPIQYEPGYILLVAILRHKTSISL